MVAPIVVAAIISAIASMASSAMKKTPGQAGSVQTGEVGKMEAPGDLFGGGGGSADAVSSALAQNPYIMARAQADQRPGMEIPAEQMATIMNNMFAKKSETPPTPEMQPPSAITDFGAQAPADSGGGMGGMMGMMGGGMPGMGGMGGGEGGQGGKC